MKYRKFLDHEVSLLGLGGMRFPLADDGQVDEAAAIELIRYAIDNGVNYLDTAYIYHEGVSETILGKALKDGYREKVFLADKMPVWCAENEQDLYKIFDTQLERLGVDYIDMYLLHSYQRESFEGYKKCNIYKFLADIKEQGKVGHVGFSFHDDYELFVDALDLFPWEFCQIQLNYMDEEMQAGVKGLKLAHERGLPVIIMEPLKGGKLTNAIPEEVQQLWDSAPVKRTPAEWALRWVADFPEVTTILSGMSNMEMLKENIEILSNCEPLQLSEEEHAIIRKAADAYNRLIKYSCTGCRYCCPCPQNINIPAVMDIVNQSFLYGGADIVKADYFVWLEENVASKCIGCGQCQNHCPQHLPIRELLVKVAETFEKK